MEKDKSGRETRKPQSESNPERGETAASPPDWADGLKQLYDAVVEEPLPDSFKDLLAQLDEQDEDSPSSSSNK
ncbi:MAG: NepR family anti-sigma factor [Erythrobacter sp.]